MLKTSIGQLLLNNALPSDLQDHSRQLDKKGTTALFDDLARRHPEQYAEVSRKLIDIGRDVAYGTGGFSFGLNHMRSSPAAERIKQQAKNEITAIQVRHDLNSKQKDDAIVAVLQKHKKPVEDAVFNESMADNNPLARQVLNVGRGNNGSLASLRAGDLLYQDHHGDPIPIPIFTPYSAGLTPVEYWAAGFGARKGIIDTKRCLAQGTLIRMADWSVKCIEDTNIGDKILGADRDGKTFPVTVVRKFENGYRNCYRYTFRVGQTQRFVSVTATEEHKVLAKLKLGHAGTTYGSRAVYTPTPLPLGRRRKDFFAVPTAGYIGTDGRDEPYALLIGLLLGDGYTVNPTRTIQLSCGDPGLIDFLDEHLRPFGLSIKRCWNGGYSYVISESTASGKSRKGPWRGRGIEFKTVLRKLGVDCKYAHEKTLPNDVLTWNQRSLSALISGLMATDGTIHCNIGRTQPAPMCRFNSTSKALVVGFRDILAARFGVHCGEIKFSLASARKWGVHDQWYVTVSNRFNIIRLFDQIDIPGVKGTFVRLFLTNLPPLKRECCSDWASQGREYVGAKLTYDLEVDHDDHLFVLENNLVVSNSTADAGFLAKQLVQVTHRLVVTAHDDEESPTSLRGLPISTDDPDSDGSLLAATTGSYPRNTVLTTAILKDLKSQGHERILIRSPVVGGPPQGGVYARDAGVRERGGLAPVGDYVGTAGGQAISEKLTQGQLSSKHAGGVAGAAQSVTGFKLINLLIQTPKEFPGGATHAQVDGRVGSIEPAPQGGTFIHIGNVKHYVPHGFDITTHSGDQVEAGDLLSNGIPNPAELVKHKGIGEGRRQFIHGFTKAYRDSGMAVNRRNVEFLARGLIDHVEVDDELGDHVPGDIIPYQSLEHDYQPRDDSKEVTVNSAVGKYLEQPVLHHTIGTKVRPSMLQDFKDFGVTHVRVHDDPPPFTPTMVRGMANLNYDPDWLTRHLGSNLKKNTLESTHRGRTADPEGTSFVPALALDRLHFGRQGLTQGWNPRDGDRDGKVNDGTAKETAAQPQQAGLLQGLKRHFRSVLDG